VHALSDISGNIANTYTYDAYGKPTSSTGSVCNPFGYTGEYTDWENGFIYLRARYYDTQTQQFLTVDPLLASTEQAYAYAEGSPTNVTDPAGTCGGRGGFRFGGMSTVDCIRMGLAEWQTARTRPWFPKGNYSIPSSRPPLPAQSRTAGIGRTSVDLFRSGNSQQPYAPRIEGFNLKPNQQPDLYCTREGLVVPKVGGISTYEQPSQLPTSGYVYRLPAGSKITWFRDVPDASAFDPPRPGHHSIVSRKLMTPEEFLERFFGWPWEKFMVGDKHLKLP
jgi:RHS repeat-associated protein